MRTFDSAFDFSLRIAVTRRSPLGLGSKRLGGVPLRQVLSRQAFYPRMIHSAQSLPNLSKVWPHGFTGALRTDISDHYPRVAGHSGLTVTLPLTGNR